MQRHDRRTRQMTRERADLQKQWERLERQRRLDHLCGERERWDAQSNLTRKTGRNAIAWQQKQKNQQT